MEPPPQSTVRPGVGQQAYAVFRKLWTLDFSPTPEYDCDTPPTTSKAREQRSEPILEESSKADNIPCDTDETDSNNDDKDTVLYLAYGSNLSAETFKGTRGIRPLSQVNVLVPELALTFDLPGLPYIEPCFANTRYRVPNAQISSSKYHKDSWHKGLVGVVYEVTKKDFSTIIATEGGGASYKNITVDAYEIPAGSKAVDPNPTSAPFKVHTLFSPMLPTTLPGVPTQTAPRVQRPDPSYAQASARYLKLIKDGAKEHELPVEYRDFLNGLQPFVLTTTRQKIGAKVFLVIWAPSLLFFLGFSKFLADKSGKVPAWYGAITEFIFRTIWKSYDSFFKKIFGEGERTLKTVSEQTLGGLERKPLLL